MFDTLWPYGLQYTRLPCPSLYPRICSNSCPLSRWWCLTHLILCHPLLLLPSIFPASESLPLSQLFASCGQSIEVSASASVLWINIQGWFPLGLTGLVSLQPKGLLRTFSNRLKVSILWRSAFFMAQLSHLYMTTGKTSSSLYGSLLAKGCLCFLYTV